MGLGLRSGIGMGGANKVGVQVSCLPEHFFQMSIPVRKMASAIPIIGAEEVFRSWSLNGQVNAFSVGLAEKFH
jgi:hypothetical protein